MSLLAGQQNELSRFSYLFTSRQISHRVKVRNEEVLIKTNNITLKDELKQTKKLGDVDLGILCKYE